MPHLYFEKKKKNSLATGIVIFIFSCSETLYSIHLKRKYSANILNGKNTK